MCFVEISQLKILRTTSRIVHTQLAHDVRTTLLRRRFNVFTSFQRPYNVVLTSCASWVELLQTTVKKSKQGISPEETLESSYIFALSQNCLPYIFGYASDESFFKKFHHHLLSLLLSSLVAKLQKLKTSKSSFAKKNRDREGSNQPKTNK